MGYTTHELEFRKRSTSEKVSKVARRENKNQTKDDK